MLRLKLLSEKISNSSQKQAESKYRYTLDGGCLTKEQRQFYEENGYIIIRNFLKSDDISKWKNRFLDYCNQNIPSLPGMQIVKDIALVKKNKLINLKGQASITKIQDFQNDQVLQIYCTNQDLIPYLKSFCGQNIKSVHTMFINKPPGMSSSSRHPYHQDLAYFPFGPTDRIVAVWASLEDTNRQNGSLNIFPKTHTGRFFDHQSQRLNLKQNYLNSIELQFNKKHIIMILLSQLNFHLIQYSNVIYHFIIFMLQNKVKMIMFLIAFLGLLSPTLQVCPSYVSCSLYSSGKITPISSFTTNQSVAVNNSLIYTTPLDILYSAPILNYYSLALGVVGIQALSSNQISFNVTVVNANQTSFSITTKILGYTYCNLLSYNYFAISYPLSITQMLIYFDCFLTADLSTTSYQSASQTFQLQTLPFPDSAYVRNIYSVLSGMRLINNQGQYFYVSLKSCVPTGTNKIQHTITTDYYNNLEFVCLSTIVVSEYYFVKQYIYQIYFDTALIDQTNLTSNVITSKVQAANMQFYGVSSLQLSAQMDISFNFDTENYADIGPGSVIGPGVSSILLSYMYFSYNQIANYAGKYYVPDTGQCVTACSTLPGYSIYATYTCQMCHYTCLTCNLPHLNGRCDTCNSPLAHRTLNATTHYCNCNSGYVDVQITICQLCSALINECLTCSSSTYCLSCSPTFTLSPDHSQCLCPGGGPKVSTFCLDYIGCQIAINATNTIYCDTCDEANHFIKILSNLTYTCTCMSGYEESGIICVDICGDGNLQNISQGCDDGNYNSSDGCSQNCTVQSGFGCYTPDNLTSSICSQIMQFSITFVYAYRIKYQNSAVMAFLVSPPSQKLSKMNFNDYISTTLPYKSFNAHYDFASSTLVITSDYKTDIENTNQQMQVNFDPSVLFCSPIVVKFKPTGVNHQLIVQQYVEINFYIKWGSCILGYLALAITFISFIVSKPLLGLEMLFPIQLTFVVLGYFSNIRASVGSLSQLKTSGGYNELQPTYSYNTNYYGLTGLLIAQQSNQFILNVNYMAVALIGVGIMTIIWKGIASYFQKEELTDQNSVRLQSGRYNKIVKLIEIFLSKKIFAFIGLVCLVPSLFALSLQLKYQSSPGFSNYITPNYNTLAAIITLIFIFLAMTECLDSQDSKTLKESAKHVEQTKIEMFFLSQLFVIALFTSLTGISYVQYVLFAIGIVPLGLHIYKSPYKDKTKFYRFVALVCYTMVLINSALFLVADVISNQMINLIIAGSILALILFCQVLTIVRVILDKVDKSKTAKIKLDLDEIYSKNESRQEQSDSPTQRQHLMDYNLQKIEEQTTKDIQQFDSTKNVKGMNNQEKDKEDFKIQNDEKQKTGENENEKHESNSDSQLQKLDELQDLKKKLRADLLLKRGKINRKKITQ